MGGELRAREFVGESRPDLAATLKKNFSTQFQSETPQGSNRVTIGYRLAQTSIATYNAVLCRLFCMDSYVQMKMLLFLDSNDFTGMC